MLKPGAIRFILAMIVIFYHITKIVFLGEFAVLCFFMLSGYWITFMYENKYKKFKSSLTVFYISRAWRLFPVFLLFNALTFLMCYFFKPNVMQAIPHTGALAQILFWFPNILIFGYDFVSPRILVTAWSLDIELQFYLVYPLLIIFFKSAKYYILTVALITAILINIFYPQSAVQKTLIYYLVFFLTGMLIYLKDLRFNKSAELACTLIFVSALALNYLVPDLRELTVGNNASSYNLHLNEVLPFLLIPLISNSLKNKSTKLDRILGDMSFVLYLCHWTLIIPYNYFINGLAAAQRMPYSLIYLISTLSFSYLIYKYFDNPIDNLRKKWVESQAIIKNNHILV